jgi:hypothetical protein
MTVSAKSGAPATSARNFGTSILINSAEVAAMSNRLNGRSLAAGRRRAAAINAMRVSSKSAEKSLRAERAGARSVKNGCRVEGWCGGRRSDAALRTGSAPARAPEPGDRDISKWHNQRYL